MKNRGVSRLAGIFDSRVSQKTKKPDVLELGVIQSDLSLKVDRYPHPIPVGDYLIAEWIMHLNIPQKSRVVELASPSYSELTRIDFKVSSDPGKVDDVHFNFKDALKPGDRVLVAWVNDGTDPVVICKVVYS